MKYTTALLLVLLTTFPAAAQPPWLVQSSTPSNWRHNGVALLPNGRVVIVGDDNILMFSDDDGETWTQTPSIPRNPSVSEDPIHAIEFVDADHGFAFGNDSFRTADGGNTWEQLPFQPAEGIDFFTPQTGFVWQNFGAYRTGDGGMSWTEIWPLTFEHDHRIYSIDFLDENTGLLSGEEFDVPGVFRTTDGGENWTRVSNDSFRRILMVDENIAIAVHDLTFFRSADGGATWTAVFEGENIFPFAIFHEECIKRIDADSFAVVDSATRVFISDDLGLTWTVTQPIPLGFGFTIGQTSRLDFAADGQHGNLVGDSGLIFKTDDGGHSWTQISHGLAKTLNTIEMNGNGLGIAAGETGAVVRTTDFGRTWIAQQIIDESAFARDINDVQMLDEDTFFMATDDARCYRSNDAGQTWSILGAKDLFGPWQFFDVHFIDENEGWMGGRSVGALGVIVHTTDGGQSWERVLTSQAHLVVNQIQMLDSLNGWALS